MLLGGYQITWDDPGMLRSAAPVPANPKQDDAGMELLGTGEVAQNASFLVFCTILIHHPSSRMVAPKTRMDHPKFGKTS